jgi:hypothetical protein
LNLRVLLIKPQYPVEFDAIKNVFCGFGQMPGDQELLLSLGLPHGFEPMTQEQAEFMIDLMDTLLD